MGGTQRMQNRSKTGCLTSLLYWDFQVEAGDVLLFNNAATCHKFINLTPNPEIFTIRVQNFTGASHLSLRNDMFNWAGAKSFAALILSRATVRDPGHYKR